MDINEEVVKNAKLYELAGMIYRDWRPINFAAKPYVEAMASLENMNSMYMCESANSVVAYFLSNAATWRGPVAKIIKAELKNRLKK